MIRETLSADRAGVARLVVALITDELHLLRGRRTPIAETRLWTDGTHVDEDGVGADSLARLRLASRLDEALALGDSGVEDYLLLEPTLGGWIEIACEGLRRGRGRLSFRTSGTTGEPKRTFHDLETLAEECRAHARILPKAERVVSLVPPHHLYGFLFGVLGPSLADLPVLDATDASPAGAFRRRQARDRLIATPHLWELALAGPPDEVPPPPAHGVSSAAPCPPEIFAAAERRGLAPLVEILGASETGGLGWRDAAEAPFRPLPHLELLPGDPPRLRRRSDGHELEPPDSLVARGEGAFAPGSRRDDAVQVGGVNVHPGRIAELLRTHPDLAECAVRLDGAGPGARLKAFVVPKTPEDPPKPESLRQWCETRLAPPERPIRFDFGAALPRSPLGKPAGWH